MQETHREFLRGFDFSFFLCLPGGEESRYEEVEDKYNF